MLFLKVLNMSGLIVLLMLYLWFLDPINPLTIHLVYEVVRYKFKTHQNENIQKSIAAVRYSIIIKFLYCSGTWLQTLQTWLLPQVLWAMVS